MKRFIGACLCTLLGGVLALCALELGFRFLPVAKGLIRTPDENQWPLQNYVGGSNYTYSFDWDMKNPQHGRSNNFGHLAPFDFGPGRKAVLVIGDSYVESQMNAYPDTLQGQLGRLLGKPESVFGLGASGLSISDYLVMASRAAPAFQPVAQVFVIIDGDLTESLQPRVGWNHFRQTADGGWQISFQPQNTAERSTLSKMLAQSALYPYLRGNLKFTVPDGFLQARQEATPQDVKALSATTQDPRVKPAIDFFLRELLLTSGMPPECTVFLLDDDRYPLYGLPAKTRLDSVELRTYFMQRARAAGMRVVELGPVFADNFRRHQQRFDHSPFDRHWNRLGNGIAADAAASQLATCPGVGPATGGVGDAGTRSGAKIQQ